MRSGHAQLNRSFLARLVRTEALRWFAAFAMIPILILTTFGGTTLVAHAHHGHSTHIHAATSISAARDQANQHLIAHALGSAHCENSAPKPQIACSTHAHFPSASGSSHADQSCTGHETPSDPPSTPLDESPDGLIISVPDQDPLVSAPVSLPCFRVSGDLIAAFACYLLATADPITLAASPARITTQLPRQHCAQPATVRIVSTNCALLL